MSDQVIDVERRRGIWLRRSAIAIVSFVLVVIATLALRWASSPAMPERSVSQQWNDAIRRLGIEPVYPPVEDIVVGDLLAMITDDADDHLASEPLAGRSLKLTPLDLSSELRDEYKLTYRFPLAAAVASSTDLPHAQDCACDDLFETVEKRQAVPSVSFSGFSISASRAAGNSGAWNEAWLALVGASAESKRSLDVKISGAETYGVSALPAEKRLFEFCMTKTTATVCTDGFLRVQRMLLKPTSPSVRTRLFLAAFQLTRRIGGGFQRPSATCGFGA